MSPVPWSIVRLASVLEPEPGEDDTDPFFHVYTITAEAPPEVVPAVWTHEGCRSCGGIGEIGHEIREPSPYSEPIYEARTCPDGRLVPWKGEEE